MRKSGVLRSITSIALSVSLIAAVPVPAANAETPFDVFYEDFSGNESL